MNMPRFTAVVSLYRTREPYRRLHRSFWDQRVLPQLTLIESDFRECLLHVPSAWWGPNNLLLQLLTTDLCLSAPDAPPKLASIAG